MSKAKTQSKVEAVVYLGPTIPGIATKNTFFNNGLSNELKAAINDMPAIGKLVVSISDYPKASSEIDKKEGAVYEFYKKALQYGKGDE